MTEKNSTTNVVLSLFFVFGEIFGRTKIQKLLFLLEQRTENLNFQYERRHYGPFSDLMNETVDQCVQKKLVEETKVMTRHATWGYHYKITDSGRKEAEEAFSELDPKIKAMIQELHDEFKDASTTDIVRYVYSKYPKMVPDQT